MDTAADLRVDEEEFLAPVGTRPFGYLHLENLQIAKPWDCAQTGR